MDTVLPTGPGCWEIAANKKKGGAAYKKKVTKVAMTSAYPSKTHMAFVSMIDWGLMKYLVSQNVDGLHRKSGVPADKISELHGNTNIERCKEWGKDYLRDFRVRNAQKVHEHLTGRKWDDPDWGGQLEDTIINFGEGLPEEELNNAFNHANWADLWLAMGSSLRVTPAADVPKTVFDNGGKLVIVNLQKTPLDAYAAINIYAKCDDVMERLMKKLNIEIPKWKIVRYWEVVLKGKQITINGRDEQHNYYSLFPKVEIKSKKDKKFSKSSEKEPHKFKLPEGDVGVCTITLHFEGHYEEKPCSFDFDTSDEQCQLFKIVYDLEEQKWESKEPLY